MSEVYLQTQTSMAFVQIGNVSLTLLFSVNDLDSAHYIMHYFFLTILSMCAYIWRHGTGLNRLAEALPELAMGPRTQFLCINWLCFCLHLLVCKQGSVIC